MKEEVRAAAGGWMQPEPPHHASPQAAGSWPQAAGPVVREFFPNATRQPIDTFE